jgi:PhnB protein
MQSDWKRAKSWASYTAHRVTTEAVTLFRPDRQRRIDALIKYFGESREGQREAATLEEYGMKDRCFIWTDALLDETQAGVTRLEPAESATTVRVRQDKVLITDGPFAETKEQLGGVHVIGRSTPSFPRIGLASPQRRDRHADKEDELMPSNVKPVPKGHRTVTPYLAIKDAAKALEFYKKAFGASERYTLMVPDGRVGHAEIGLGDSIVMLSDEFPEYGGKAPEALGGSPVSIHLYVEDVDAFFKKALAAGARERKPVMDQFYGDRSGQLEDPFGHLWWVATHKEDVAPEEMQKRVQAMFAGSK